VWGMQEDARNGSKEIEDRDLKGRMENLLERISYSLPLSMDEDSYEEVSAGDWETPQRERKRPRK